ncbi:hypothetical protein L484_015922 [Morus notabilis]|uniref:Uncharacterized protein n=1 Tax=Morus notabilis TaxID=981085 RepID=W9QPQ5_9ROSA|nr:hypothetical protein L484_015922 [Morus notabilis]
MASSRAKNFKRAIRKGKGHNGKMESASEDARLQRVRQVRGRIRASNGFLDGQKTKEAGDAKWGTDDVAKWDLQGLVCGLSFHGLAEWVRNED